MTDNLTLEPNPSVATAPPSRRRRSRWLVGGGLWLRLLAAVAVLVGWWMLAIGFPLTGIPSPLATGVRLIAIVSGNGFVTTVLLTLGRVAVGMVVTVTAAMAIGVAMGRSRMVERLLDTFVLVGRSIPALVWALVAVMVAGVNNFAPVLAVFLTATPLVILQVWEASKAMDRDLFDMAAAFGVGRLGRLRRIVLPAVVPSIVAGTKLGLALAWQVVVLSELLGLDTGVGYEIHSAFSNFDLAGVLAWTICFSAIMAFLEYGVIGMLQRRLERWRPKTQAGRP